MRACTPRNPLAELASLPDWRVKKLHDIDLALYVGALREAESDLQGRLGWVLNWKSRIEYEIDKRKAAVEEIRRRREKDARQAKVLAEHQAALERKYISDQYAE